MNKFYPTLFSPIRVGNVVLKNRMICAPSKPHFIQAEENYPSAQLILHYANRARAGAAIVTVDGNHAQRGMPAMHMAGWNLNDATTQHYCAQMADAIHYYGSRAHHVIMCRAPWGYDVSAGVASHYVVGDGSRPIYDNKELPKEEIYKIIEEEAQLCKVAQTECGFDGTYIHMSYRGALTGRFLSPLTNKRTDEFGGSFENRIRFAKLLCSRIKELCGSDFLIEASVSGHDPLDQEGGVTIEDTIRFAHEMEGLIDILTLRSPHIDPQHPTGFTKERTPWLYMAEAVKKSNPKMLVAASSGFFYPEDCEAALASGKADVLSMARAFVSNVNYGKVVSEGRRGDLVPCIRCNKCHKASPSTPWISMCSVNPLWAQDGRSDKMGCKPDGVKKVAVIGGGVSGMEAAQVAADRGHSVTVFEKTDRLGGLLNHTDGVAFKWPLRDFRDYMVRKTQENPRINIIYNTAPTAEELESAGFNVVLAAVGSKPITPRIPGVDGGNVVNAIDVYGHEDECGANVVVIGGGDIGTETGLHLAQKGHKVTVIEMKDMLAAESYRVHYYSMMMDSCEGEENFSYVLKATCRQISENAVTYTDENGAEVTLPCDTVVIAAGMRARTDEAMDYASAGDLFRMIGDCSKVGSVMTCMRSAYSTATTF